MKLYSMKAAPNPRRVRMFLAEKNIDVPTVEIDIRARENLNPAYLAINPRGVVPALLLDDGTVIDESVAICRYFEELQPEPNLMGRDAKEKAVIESWQRHMEFDGLFSVALVFRNAVPHFKDRAHPGVIGQVAQLPELAERGRTMTAHFLDTLERQLATNAYIAGDRFTIADITAFCALDMAKWVKLFPTDSHPHIQRWHDKIAARPSTQA